MFPSWCSACLQIKERVFGGRDIHSFLNNEVTQSIIHAQNVQLEISNALLKFGRLYLFTLFEGSPNNMKEVGVYRQNIKISVCSLIYLLLLFRAQFTWSAGWTSEPFG